MNLSISQAVSRATEALQNKGYLAYLVGGCVRDLLLGKEPEDWDITTNATPEEIVALFPKTFYENRFGTVTVVNEEEAVESLKQIEITPFRLETKYSDFRHPDTVTWGKTLADDLKRRDFTINALAYDPVKQELVDLYKGQGDLKDKTIRAVGNPKERFTEDPLRMLRAIRFATQLGFVINSDTAEAIINSANLIKEVPMERVKDEFTKIIMSPEPMVGLVMANRMALLSNFLPELEEGIHVKQNGDHIYDVWEHILRVLQHSADKNHGLEVRLAALFHDIGKPRTRDWGEEKKDWTFYGHEIVSAKMAKVILNRLKFPVKTIETTTSLIRNHMFFSDIEKISLSAVRRIIRNVGRDHIWELMEVRMCDRIGMGRPKEESYRLRKYESMIVEALRAPTSVGMLQIDGNELTRETGLKPGPKIGHILHALLEEVLDNPDLNTKEYLVKRAKKLAILSDEELEKLGGQGKEKKGEVEEQELEKIRRKFRVN